MPLERADAVLAGGRAAEPQAELHHRLERLLGPSFGGRVVALDDDGRVHVAVADVAGAGDHDVLVARDLLDAAQQVGQPWPRHRDVVDSSEPSVSAGVDQPAGLEQQLGLLLVGGLGHLDGAVLVQIRAIRRTSSAARSPRSDCASSTPPTSSGSPMSR